MRITTGVIQTPLNCVWSRVQLVDGWPQLPAIKCTCALRASGCDVVVEDDCTHCESWRALDAEPDARMFEARA